MGLTWGLRISQDSTDVIGDTSWHGPKMALHAVQLKPVCTNIFPCWRCVSKKNLTRIQIIPNASPVQLSILTPQNYISYFGDLGTPREQVHPSIEGSSNPLCLCVGWNLPCLPCKSCQVTWSAWDPSGGVSYKCGISTNVTRLGEKKTQFIGIQREKVTWKNECFFGRKQLNRNSNPSCTILELLTGDRGSSRHFEKAVWRSTALDKERLSI